MLCAIINNKKDYIFIIFKLLYYKKDFASLIRICWKKKRKKYKILRNSYHFNNVLGKTSFALSKVNRTSVYQIVLCRTFLTNILSQVLDDSVFYYYHRHQKQIFVNNKTKYKKWKSTQYTRVSNLSSRDNPKV